MEGLNLNSLVIDENGRVSFSGLSSGIDFQEVTDSIIAARRIPIDSLEALSLALPLAFLTHRVYTRNMRRLRFSVLALFLATETVVVLAGTFFYIVEMKSFKNLDPYVIIKFFDFELFNKK